MVMSSSHPKKIEDLDWFHPNVDRHVAESLLMQNGEEGSYLLRPSSKAHTYTLSVRGQASVKHYNLTVQENEYKFGMAVFYNLDDFIAHFNSQPLLAGESGVVTLLRYPYPRVVAEPVQYDSVKVHAQIGRPSVQDDFTQRLSLASKEGFLTKQGGVVKNWKLRWFVLKKNELQYFSQRTDKDPIRSIDLRECCECSLDTTLGRENCIRLVFPWRTFYLSAGTSADAKEWIDIIQWKLNRTSRKSH